MESGKKKAILFVDDDPWMLESVERMLHSKRNVWEIRFAKDGPSALESLAENVPDLIVSDMRMPGMSGAQLLDEVRKRHPRVTRMILTGQSDLTWAMQSVPLAHQFLAKPCRREDLLASFQQAFALEDLLHDPGLRKVLHEIDTLPSLPTLYLQLQGELASNECSIERIAEIVSRDIGMTAKIMQLVNSAFFGLPQRLTSPQQAVLFLGLKTLESLVVSIHIFSQFQHGAAFGGFAEALWDHSLAVSRLARGIALEESRNRDLADEAALAGMLADCGKLILADRFPKDYMQVLSRCREGDLPPWKVEEEILGTSHGLVGGYLMSLWGLPKPVIEALAFSHHPLASCQRAFSSLTAVHAADALLAPEAGGSEEEGVPGLDSAYLESLGLSHRLPDWRALQVRERKGVPS